MSHEESKRARESVDRLLAGRDQLTVDEKHAIFARVLADPAVAPRRGVWRVWGGIGATAALASVLVMMALPRGGEELTPKGGATPSFTVACAPSPCAVGATLLFELAPAEGQHYFAAFGRASDGKVIWYFPESESAVGLSTDALRHGVAKRGVAIGSEHGPGHFVVTGVFSPTGLTRGEVRALIEGKVGAAAVVERTFDVGEGAP